MAEIIGTIASVLTLVGLLEGCIDACELIRAARNQEKDLEKLDLKLALEQCRLKSWGKSMGLIREAGRSRRSLLEDFEFCAVVQRALELIVKLLTDSERLSSRYGAKQVAVEEGVQLVAKSRSVSKLKAAFKRLTITDSTHEQATKVKRKSFWVLHDRKKYEDLIVELRELVDGVEKITKDLVGREQQQDLVISRINTINDIRTLNMLSEACELDYPAISDATSIRADTISMVSTQQGKIIGWIDAIDETVAADSQMEVTEEMESWDLRAFREQYLGLLNISRTQEPSKNDQPLDPDQPSRQSPVDFNEALTYVDKVKVRFHSRHMMYKYFLDILQTYQRDMLPIKEVHDSLTKLFESEPDLMEGFNQFLPIDWPRNEAKPLQDGDSSTEASIGLNALIYMDYLRETTGYKRYNKFSDILRRFQHQDINAADAMRQVMLLFHDRHDLLRRFNIFLPPGYAIFGEDGAPQATTPEGHTWDIASLLAESTNNETIFLSEETASVRINTQLREKPGRRYRVKRLSRQVDMNSLVVLKYLEELVLFRQDVEREVLVFPPNISLARQHALCTLSHRLGLSYNTFAGETAGNQIVVSRLPRKPYGSLTPLRRSLMVKNLKYNSRTAIDSEDSNASWELEEQGADLESQGWETASSVAEDSDQ
ncbi:Transcriptional regulatory protein SIN3 [Trichoderma lentiforme]|uniref:Transcriptional regulatory protein SIN3 n=1 Tax=Trichoderma lentiforme TaxID=1567552 RepID=A0A9P4XR19_9HYPO|nr:Transcriptional regulatory protein SIN3 [Trichoderma lentiforme]